MAYELLKAEENSIMKNKRKKIEYKGKHLTITEIAKIEGISRTTLERYYDKTGDIYKAIETYREKVKKSKERKEKKQANAEKRERTRKKEYNEEEQRLSEIAKREKINLNCLKECVEEVKDVDKGILLAKYKERRKQKVPLNGTTVSLYDMSVLIGVRYRDLINLLNEGMPISEIKGKYQTQYAGENAKLRSGKTLLEYTVDGGYDFALFYRAIVTYRKKASEAVKLCESGDNEIPIHWILERYGQSFSKLGLKDAQTTAIMYDLRKRKMTLDEAIEGCTIRKNARKIGISDEWGETLYSLDRMRQLLGKEFHSEISIDENERKFIEECNAELLELKRRFQESSDPMQKKKQPEGMTH